MGSIPRALFDPFRYAVSGFQLRAANVLHQCPALCFSPGPVMARARLRPGDTARNNVSSVFDSTTPLVYFPGSFLAESSEAFCAGGSFLDRASSSISAGGMFKQIYHSVMLSMVCAALGKSARFCVANQNHAPSLRHILPLDHDGRFSLAGLQ